MWLEKWKKKSYRKSKLRNFEGILIQSSLARKFLNLPTMLDTYIMLMWIKKTLYNYCVSFFFFFTFIDCWWVSMCCCIHELSIPWLVLSKSCPFCELNKLAHQVILINELSFDIIDQFNHLANDQISVIFSDNL